MSGRALPACPAGGRVIRRLGRVPAILPSCLCCDAAGLSMHRALPQWVACASHKCYSLLLWPKHACFDCCAACECRLLVEEDDNALIMTFQLDTTSGGGSGIMKRFHGRWHVRPHPADPEHASLTTLDQVGRAARRAAGQLGGQGQGRGRGHSKVHCSSGLRRAGCAAAGSAATAATARPRCLMVFRCPAPRCYNLCRTAPSCMPIAGPGSGHLYAPSL